MVSTSSPCMACRFLRRKFTLQCIFAPYFPLDQPWKFANVHKVLGASKVQNLLSELPINDREDIVNWLCYEAETRRQDPVYGCVTLMSVLQHWVQQLQCALHDAHEVVTAYQEVVLQTQQVMGVAGFPATQPTPAMMNHLCGNPLSSSSSSVPYNMVPMMGIPAGDGSLGIHEPGPQSSIPNDTFNPEQLVIATTDVVTEQTQQEIIWAFEMQQHSQNIRFDGDQGFNVGAGSSSGVGTLEFSRNYPPVLLQLSPSSMLGSFERGFTNHHFPHQLNLQPRQGVAVEEHHTLEQEENSCKDPACNSEAETDAASH